MERVEAGRIDDHATRAVDVAHDAPMGVIVPSVLFDPGDSDASLGLRIGAAGHSP